MHPVLLVLVLRRDLASREQDGRVPVPPLLFDVSLGLLERLGRPAAQLLGHPSGTFVVAPSHRGVPFSAPCLFPPCAQPVPVGFLHPLQDRVEAFSGPLVVDVVPHRPGPDLQRRSEMGFQTKPPPAVAVYPPASPYLYHRAIAALIDPGFLLMRIVFSSALPFRICNAASIAPSNVSAVPFLSPGSVRSM